MILAVVGGKGGVGKSTVAFNLGAELDAVVVDADLSMADLPTARGPDLHDVLAGRAAPVEAVREDGPVAILPCGRSLAGVRACEPTALVDAVQTVADAYGNVVVDCPGGMGGDVGLGLHVAAASVLVTAPTPAALGDAVRAHALANELDATLVGVVLNRTSGGQPADLVERQFGAPVTTVPEDDRVAAAQASGRPVRTVAPDSAVAAAFADLAERVRRAVTRLANKRNRRGLGHDTGTGSGTVM